MGGGSRNPTLSEYMSSLGYLNFMNETKVVQGSKRMNVDDQALAVPQFEMKRVKRAKYSPLMTSSQSCGGCDVVRFQQVADRSFTIHQALGVIFGQGKRIDKIFQLIVHYNRE